MKRFLRFAALLCAALLLAITSEGKADALTPAQRRSFMGRFLSTVTSAPEAGTSALLSGALAAVAAIAVRRKLLADRRR
jgi:hypothetical protein